MHSTSARLDIRSLLFSAYNYLSVVCGIICCVVVLTIGQWSQLAWSSQLILATVYC